MESSQSEGPAHKKRRRDPSSSTAMDTEAHGSDTSSTESGVDDDVTEKRKQHPHTSLTAPVSPPTLKSRTKTEKEPAAIQGPSTNEEPVIALGVLLADETIEKRSSVLSSPIRLTRVQGLPSITNVDTVSLRDLIGDPLIKECWAFNYTIDVEFILLASLLHSVFSYQTYNYSRKNFDEDVRDQIALTLVHGSWKHGDPQKDRIDVIAFERL